MSSIPLKLTAQASAFLSAPARWDRTMFRSLESEDGTCPSAIDITGAARCLVFGPYVQVSQGLWRATVSLELCEEAARRRISVQLGSIVGGFTTLDLPPGVPGRHDIEVQHLMNEGDLVEMRIWVMTAAFHGELRFLGVDIEPVADARASPRAKP